MKHIQNAQNISAHIRVGQIGEQIATERLVNGGFVIIERNYRKKWGEIDIVARETNIDKGKVHFFEVKTVSYETIDHLGKAVSRGTYRPEERVHSMKFKRLARTVETWVSENSFTGNYQIDVISVRIVPREKYATVNVIYNVILE